MSFGVCLLRETFRTVMASFLSRTPLRNWGTGILLTALFALVMMGKPAWEDGMGVLIVSACSAFVASAVLSVFALHGALVPGLVYSIGSTALPKLIPVVPGTPERLTLLSGLLLNLMFLIVLDCDLAPEREEKKQGKKPLRFAWLLPAICLLVCVGFFRGLLPWEPTAIVTGSMTPEIQVGDMVIVSKLNVEIQVGDVIQFSRDGEYIVHRVVEITEVDGHEAYLTQGDANNARDSGSVAPEDVVGEVIAVVPSVGKLSLWLHENNSFF